MKMKQKWTELDYSVKPQLTPDVGKYISRDTEWRHSEVESQKWPKRTSPWRTMPSLISASAELGVEG